MSLGVPGNAVVVNFLMRFPALVPIAAAAGITTVAVKETSPPPVAVIEQKIEVPPLVPLTVVEAPPPVVIPRPAPPVLVCPPADKLTKTELSKLTPRERGQLKVRGCIKG